MDPQNVGEGSLLAPFFATFFEDRFFYAPRMPADPFARSAVSSQRSLLAAQFSRSAVSIIPSKPGRAPGVGPLGPQRRGPLRGPGAHFYAPKGPFGALGPMGTVGMISELFRMECFSDGVSPLAIHALQKWG